MIKQFEYFKLSIFILFILKYLFNGNNIKRLSIPSLIDDPKGTGSNLILALIPSLPLKFIFQSFLILNFGLDFIINSWLSFSFTSNNFFYLLICFVYFCVYVIRQVWRGLAFVTHREHTLDCCFLIQRNYWTLFVKLCTYFWTAYSFCYDWFYWLYSF